MKKTTSLFAAIALATTIGLAGCKKDKKNNDQPAPAPTDTTKPADTMTKPAETTTPTTPPPADTTKPADTAAPATGAGTGMAECDDYLKTVEAYGKCDKLPPAAKDATQKSVDAMKATWGANMTDDAKKAAAGGCKTSTDALKTAAKQIGCEI